MTIKKDHIYILIGFLLINTVLFHDILLQYPDIISGNKILFQEDLVPYFDLKTQYLDNIFSTYDQLLDRTEIRTEYYFPTSWVRYYLLLPIMLVLLNAIAGYLMWYSTHILFTKFCNKNMNIEENICIFFAAIPPYLLMMYSKIAYFFNLIIGFGLFSLAISLFFLNIKKFNIKYFVLIWILIFFNPAIHFVFLFFPVIMIITIYFLLFYSRYNVESRYNIVKQFVLLMFLILIPKYIIFNIILSIGNIQESIAVSYSSLVADSIYPISTSLSLENFANINKVIYNMPTFIADKPNYLASLFVALLPMSLLVKTSKNEKVLIINSMLIFFLGFVSSMGPESPLSYYRYIYQLIDIQYIGKAVLFFLEVLRLPHRWQFLEYYGMVFILSLVFISLYYQVRKFSNRKLTVGTGKSFSLFVIFALTITPFIANDRYRDTFISGNYNGFLEPYTVPQDIKNIKYILDEDKNRNRIDGRLFVLPQGASMKIVSDDGIQHSYIDALYLYYFDIPSIEAGSASQQEKRMFGFLIWYSIINLDDKLFYKLLIDNNVSRIFIHDDILVEKQRPFANEKYVNNMYKIIYKLIDNNNMKIEYSSDKYLLIGIKKLEEVKQNSENSEISFINKNLIDVIELYKGGGISFDNLTGLQKENVIKDISIMYNATYSDIYLYDVPYTSTKNITPSYSVMRSSASAVNAYKTSKSLITGIYGAIGSNYILLKNDAYIDYSLKTNFRKVDVYLRSAGKIRVNVYGTNEEKLCEESIRSDNIKNIYVCTIDRDSISIKLTALQEFSIIDSIILVRRN